MTAFERDPDNHYFGSGTLRRLDAESLRDSILQASGELELASNLSSTINPSAKEDYRYEHRGRLRAVYLPWFRNALPELIREFDGANPSVGVSQRNRSTVATQALTLMNNPWIHERALAAMRSMGELSLSQDAVQIAFRNALARDPSSEELLWADDVLREGSIATLVKLLFSSVDFRYAP